MKRRAPDPDTRGGRQAKKPATSSCGHAGDTAHVHGEECLRFTGFVLPVQPSKQPLYVCSVAGCGASYTTQNGLKYHRLVHDGTLAFACDFEGCTSRFCTKSLLTTHMRTHTNERPYICQFDGCESSFKTSSALRDHTQTHTKEKSHACEYEGCGVTFAKKSHLKIHIRTHSKKRIMAACMKDVAPSLPPLEDLPDIRLRIREKGRKFARLNAVVLRSEIILRSRST